MFVNVIDPVSGGFVESLARPGGNATGFILFEYTTSGKLVELLKQIAPSVTRAAVLSDMRTASGSGQLGAIQSAASQLGVEFHPVGVRDARRDRARHNRFRAWIEWRLDCYGEHASA